MASFWHRIGVYFGVAEQTEHEQAAAADSRPVPWWRRSLAILAVVVIAGGGTALVDGDVWSGVRFGVFMAVSFAALDIYRTRREHSEEPR